MNKVAIIPLRKGSKSILNKNRKKLLGRLLFTWCLNEAIKSELDYIYVFTDDEIIFDYVKSNYLWSEKVIPVKRSKKSATDNASTEFAMIELASKIEYDIFVLLQATSPLTEYKDINNVLNLIIEGKYDSALSVVKTKRFTWTEKGQSLNYSFKSRPRRQNFEGLIIENGAIYACTKEIFEQTKTRIGGDIGLYFMDEDTLIEIDEPYDWLILEKLLQAKLEIRKDTPSKKIKQVIIDVDGIFTDSKVLYNESGEFAKSFSVRDGMGIELLKENNVDIAVFTSENSQIVKRRMEKLNIEDVFVNVKDKYSLLDYYLNRKEIQRSEVAYLGDDINDLSNLLSSGWAIVPSDSDIEVKSIADIELKEKGGEKFVREAIRFIIKFNKRY